MQFLQKHCNEEQLLAFLDRELSPEMRRAVEDHLARCWNCRGKLSDLESRAQQLAALLGNSGFLGSGRIAAAKSRFLDAVRHEGEVDPARAYFALLNRSAISRPLVTSVLAAGAIAAVLVVWNFQQAARRDPASIVAEAVRAEAAALGPSFHQRFRVDLVQKQPRQTVQTTALEAWSDIGRRRFAWRWKGSKEELKYAVWQPDANRRFEYDESRRLALARKNVASVQPVPLSSLAKAAAAGTGSPMEERFKAWILSREWRPIAIAEDFALFVNQQGVLLRSQRSACGAARCVTLVATSSQADERVSMSLQVDAVTSRPRLQQIVFESGEQRMAITLTAEREEAVPAARLQPALFSPDVAIKKSEPETSHAVPPLVVTPEPGEAELIEAEINIEYELHRLGACTGESITVERQGSSGLTVQGVIESESRRDELLAALQGLALPTWAKLNLLTLDEAAARALSDQSVQPAAGGAQPVIVSEGHAAKDGLPLDSYLLEYFRSHAAPALIAEIGRHGKLPETPQQQVAAYSSLLVSLSQQSYRQSWAIRRLADKFGERQKVNEKSGWLLEAMLRDHSRELQRVLAQIRTLLEPAFDSLPKPAAVSLESQAQSGIDKSVWTTQAGEIFKQADAIDTVLFNLFASGREDHPEQAISRVLSGIPRLLTKLQQTETAGLDSDTHENFALTRGSEAEVKRNQVAVGVSK